MLMPSPRPRDFAFELRPAPSRALSSERQRIEVSVHLHVPEDFKTARDSLETLEVKHWLHEPVDVTSATAVREAVISTDSDIVLAA